MTKKFLSLFLFLCSSVMFAESIVDSTPTEDEQRASTYRDLKLSPSNTITSRTYNDPTGETEHTQRDSSGKVTKEWNAKDWQGYFQQNGSGGDKIGNVRMDLGDMFGADKAFGGNPNEMSSGALSTNESTKDAPVIKAWTDAYQSEVAGDSVSHNTVAITTNQTVKCYITRDLPISWQCSKTLQTFGGGMNENGLRAKQQCDENCYEQYACLSVNNNPTVNVINIDNLSLTTVGSSNVSKTLSSDTKLYKITFDVEIENLNNATGGYIYLDITYLDKTQIKPLATKYRLSANETKTIYVNDYVDQLDIKVTIDKSDTKATLKNIKAEHQLNSQFICRESQDISDSPPNQYALKCPSGNIIEFTSGITSYKICADYGIVGDNRNGTFSTQAGCENICRKPHACSIYTGNMTTSSLEQFREGCIAGQSNCSTNTCKNLRLTNTPILAENVFNASGTLTKTIENSNQIQGVVRPRVLLSEDVNFQARTQEEWKDEAYLYMINNQNYKISSFAIGEDTEQSDAYNINISTTNSIGMPKRGLMWVLKPKAYDVGKNQYMYAIVEAIFQRSVLLPDGTKEYVKNKVLYAKTGAGDSFKAFAIKRDWARSNTPTNSGDVMQDLSSTYTENLSSYWEYKTFNSGLNTWVGIGSSGLLESFQNGTLTVDKPYKRIGIINDIGSMLYTLPGRARRISSYQVSDYVNTDDGTGETFANYKVYTLNKNSLSLTYSDIVTMIDNKEITPIFDALSQGAYPKSVKNDNGGSEENINMYLYGEDTSKQGFIRILPRKDELGKKGFIFIFAY